MVQTTRHSPRAGLGAMTVTLPGADRKRTPANYAYRVTYRSPDPATPGCVMTWHVRGGRQTYQVALERTEGGTLRWHCSCADAVYRGDGDPRHACKHISGLRDCLPPVA